MYTHPPTTPNDLQKGFSVPIDWELKFREAADQGSIESMQSIYRNHKPNVNAQGQQSGQTAAHRAAHKGHAPVLRLLYNLGADFFRTTDKKGFLPQQLTTKPECLKIFKLALLGKKTLDVVNKIIPNKITETNPSINKIQFLEWRDLKKAAVEEMTKTKLNHLLYITLSKEMAEIKLDNLTSNTLAQESKLFDANWLKACFMPIHYLCACYSNLRLAIEKKQKDGACGENSQIAYAYLSAVEKTEFSIDAIVIEENLDNHAVTLLNLKENQWDQAFIIDSLYNKCFFYSFHQELQLPYNVKLLESSACLCSSPLRLPDSNYKNTTSELQGIVEEITKDTHALFSGQL